MTAPIRNAALFVLLASALQMIAPPALRGGPISQGNCGNDPNNLVLNCGFETGNFTGWTQLPIQNVTGYGPAQFNFAGIGVPGSTFFSSFPANSGSYAAAFGGSGQISQSLVVIRGDSYKVSFYLNPDAAFVGDTFFAAGNYPYIVGDPTHSPDFGTTYSAPGSSYCTGTSNSYFQCGFTFTAVSTEADLSFGDFPVCDQAAAGDIPCSNPPINSANPLYPFLLDDITVDDCTAHPSACVSQTGSGPSVPQPTPEPGGLFTVLGAAVVLVNMARRRLKAGKLESALASAGAFPSAVSCRSGSVSKDGLA